MAVNELALDKKTLRAELRARLRRIGAERWRSASAEAAARIIATPEFQRALTVMIFLPLRHEVDARPIALRAWQDGKTITVPLVGPDRRLITPVVVRSLEEPMDEDHYGVPTPRNCQPIPPDMLDLVLVPGLGFDETGRRIGRGCGYYDRFLAQTDLTAVKCGLAISEQIVPHVPTDPHDVPVDMLATDSQLLRFDPSTRADRY